MNIIISAVGGQGAILASKIIGKVSILSNRDVKISEVHGMAQRGGSVICHIRYDEDKVYSPIVEKGRADIILAFEKLEGFRNLSFLKQNGKLILNDHEIEPMTVKNNDDIYPKNIIDYLNKLDLDLISVKANRIAFDIGNIKIMNVILLGILANETNFKIKLWRKALKEVIPKKYLDINLKAFEAGLNYNN